MTTCKLALEDGTVFTGRSFGATGTASGEAVFNTAMTGYQEVLTDPSYSGQIVTMTYPLIGNYGVNAEDVESGRLYVSGFVLKEIPPLHSNHRATQKLSTYLRTNKVVGLAGVDTRAITRRLRNHGSLRAVLSTEVSEDAALIRVANSVPVMRGQNLAAKVAGHAPKQWRSVGAGGLRIVALDCGIKYNILRTLTALGCDVTAVSGLSPVEEILEHRPQSILVANGPGDPAAVHDSIKTIRQLIGRVPLFGICLGHQLLACALGAEIYKLKFGHHGANHPVRNVASGQVEITSQNHGFAVAEGSLAAVGAYPTHINLNDRSLEGFAHRTHPLFAVQYHPEAAPGPHDSAYLFDLFLKMTTHGTVPDEIGDAQR